MIRRIILLGVACGLMSASVGCGTLYAVLCPIAACDQPCGDASCGAVCDAPCGPMCDACGPMSGLRPPCGETVVRGPLDLVASLFAVDAWNGCGGGGCGETYYGDYPSDCDPCDQCGNYTGVTL